MIRLGLRLAVAGGREALSRLALIAVAVAAGTCLLLATLAAINAFETQNQRYAWLETGYVSPTQPAPATVDPLWWRLRSDTFEGDVIGRVDLAATGPDSPIPPGLPALPGPGEYYASPALVELLASTPADQLGDRFPGTLTGTIGPAALPAPDTLLVVIGHEPSELAEDAVAVTEISTVSPADCGGECAPDVGTAGEAMTLVLSVVAAALLFPVLAFIGVATRLSAARREQRFAAMRLVGATPRQITTLAVTESTVATVAGVAAGFGTYLASRPLLAKVPFTGDRFFTSDLSLGLGDILLVAIGIPVAAAVAARLALRRVTISPLGITRRAPSGPPRAWRLLPLVAGVVWFAYLAFVSDIGASQNSADQAMAYLAGMLLIMTGLLVAGPWFTRVAAGLTARRARGPAGLIAARRLHDNPHSAFRAVSGVVLAVFVASCSIGIITTIVASNDGAAGDPATARGTLVYQQFGVPVNGEPSAVTDELIAAVLASPGVETTAKVYETPRHDGPDDGGPPPFLASCQDLADAPVLGRCPPGADVVSVELRFAGAVIDGDLPMSEMTWPASTTTLDELHQLRVGSFVVTTDGSSAAVERARTLLDRLAPSTFAPETFAEHRQRTTDDISRLQRLAQVVLLASLPIAGGSLAVSVAGGLADRRRPFSLLRLTGAPLSLLRRVIALEATVPLLASVVVAAGSGLTAAALFLQAQTDQTFVAPGVSYYLLIAAGVAVSLGIVASTLPLLARLTGPEAARND